MFCESNVGLLKPPKKGLLSWMISSERQMQLVGDNKLRFAIPQQLSSSPQPRYVLWHCRVGQGKSQVPRCHLQVYPGVKLPSWMTKCPKTTHTRIDSKQKIIHQTSSSMIEKANQIANGTFDPIWIPKAPWNMHLIHHWPMTKSTTKRWFRSTMNFNVQNDHQCILHMVFWVFWLGKGDVSQPNHNLGVFIGRSNDEELWPGVQWRY